MPGISIELIGVQCAVVHVPAQNPIEFLGGGEVTLHLQLAPKFLPSEGDFLLGLDQPGIPGKGIRLSIVLPAFIREKLGIFLVAGLLMYHHSSFILDVPPYSYFLFMCVRNSVLFANRSGRGGSNHL